MLSAEEGRQKETKNPSGEIGNLALEGATAAPSVSNIPPPTPWLPTGRRGWGEQPLRRACPGGREGLWVSDQGNGRGNAEDVDWQGGRDGRKGRCDGGRGSCPPVLPFVQQ